jgi:hypothetical protein
MEGQANFLAEWEALGDWREGDVYAARVLAATPGEVTDAVRRHLAPDQASLMVYRPQSAPPFADGVESAFAALDAVPDSTLAPIDVPAAPDAPRVTTALVPERTHGSISVFRTPRGVPILVRRKPGRRSPGLYARGGTTNETERAGLATLLARTSLKGTARRTADLVALETELLGGSIAAVTSDGLGWTLWSAARLAAGSTAGRRVLDPRSRQPPSRPSAAWRSRKAQCATT